MPGMNGTGPHGFGPGTGGGFGRCGAGRGLARRGFGYHDDISEKSNEELAAEIALLRKQTAAMTDRLEALSARFKE